MKNSNLNYHHLLIPNASEQRVDTPTFQEFSYRGQRSARNHQHKNQTFGGMIQASRQVDRPCQANNRVNMPQFYESIVDEEYVAFRELKDIEDSESAEGINSHREEKKSPPASIPRIDGMKRLM
jgi:hypothetical protein